MKKRTLALFSILPFITGFLMASLQTRQPIIQASSLSPNNILPSDTIVLSSNGDIYKLTQNNSTQITHGQNLIEPIVTGSSIIAVEKTTNYSSLFEYNLEGNKISTLFSGKGDNIDTMNWITDPTMSADHNTIAYVSDKDRGQTNVPDNALYAYTLSDRKTVTIAKPDPYSGGITHPTYDPTNENIILYNYYQYDPQTLTPYSTIEEYAQDTGLTTTLTFEDKNAYQQSFSPDGKQLLFLGRNGDTSTVTLYLADLTEKGLTNIQSLGTGDFAYPTFSNTKNHIYYLQSEGNNGYNLVTATLQNNTLTHVLSITNGFQLLGNSSYTVTK